MPQYEVVFLFCFFLQWQGHESKMFMKNMAAFHSHNRVAKRNAKKENEGMFVLNKQRQEEFVYTQIWRMLHLEV